MTSIFITVAPIAESVFSRQHFEKVRKEYDGHADFPFLSWEDWQNAGSQPTLILIDAHASFSHVVSFFVDTFAGTQLDGRGPISIAFVSPDAVTLSKPTSLPPELKDSLIANSFLIRMVRSYRWGRLTRFDLLSGLMKRLSIAKSELFSIDDAAIQNWKKDVDRCLQHFNVLSEKVSQDIVGNNPVKTPVFHKMDTKEFIFTLASVYLFGRSDQSEVENLVKEIGPTWLRSSPGVYQLKEKRRTLFHVSSGKRLSDTEMLAWRSDGSLDPSKNDRVYELIRLATKRLIIDAKIKMVEHLRDISKCMARGAAAWAARSKKDNESPVRVLAVKDFVRQPKESAEVENAFRASFMCAFREGDVLLDCIVGAETRDPDRVRGWNTFEWWKEAIVDQNSISVKRIVPNEIDSLSSCILDYDIIVIEMEYRTRFVGLSIVHWLAMALDELEKTDGRRAANRGTVAERNRPQIVVLSRNEKAGHSYFCLSHGANTFAHKSRVFSLPSLLAYSQVGKEFIPAEPRYSRPNFRVLYGLLPGTASRLRSEHPEDKLLGDDWDRSWFREMPKADLHYHLGTSVTLPTITALAFNTAGYVVKRSTKMGVSIEDELLSDVCKTVIMSNLALNAFESARKPFSAHESLWGAARFIRVPKERNGAVVRPHLPEKGALEQAVEWLTPRDRPYDQFEVCGVLVAAIKLFEEAIIESGKSADHKFYEILKSDQFRDRVVRQQLVPWAYLHAISSIYEGTSDSPNRPPESDPASTPLCKELLAQLNYLMNRISLNWKHAETRVEIDQMRRESLNHSSRTTTNPVWLRALHENVSKRVEHTVHRLSTKFTELLTSPAWLEDEYKKFTDAGAAFMTQPNTMNVVVSTFWRHSKSRFPGINDSRFDCITLDSLVTLPDTVGSPDCVPLKDRTLQRYLWGAGLLGAEHFQFPENLLLASQDIVRQNVDDNVVYSEVRCGTNGYCRAGLGPQDATDVLCIGFDLSAVYYGWIAPDTRRFLIERSLPLVSDLEIPDEPQQRWVRTNVLLGAKRHKNPDEFAEVVSLTRQYMERGREPRSFWDNGAGASNLTMPGEWWDQSAVVGFDLSGDESSEFHGLRDGIRPLFVVSAPITIHAGEAATAESIWDAVYSLGAQRIGHGLRLRDDQQLLNFCSRRGICMELCPISNSFTNVFDPLKNEARSTNSLYDENNNRRGVYPLRAFLNAGLDVCINTDNRSLHKRSTLTDEYLTAAKLIGGMTCWEALKLAKAGFKCAFLSKRELAALLRHVEFEVFQMVAGQEDDINFKSPGRVVRKDKK